MKVVGMLGAEIVKTEAKFSKRKLLKRKRKKKERLK